MVSMRRGALLAAASALAITIDIAAVNQAAAAEASDPTQQLEEVVVTARRRAEALQDVPQSIQALSGETLQARGVRVVNDLMIVTPGLQINATATAGKNKPGYELRGIGISDVLGTQDQAIGTYVNDVYLARNSGLNQALYDMENVQVLYGPQGTLFGRNTTAGAILYTSKRPVDHFEAEANSEFGSYGAWGVGGMVNIPVNEKVGLRLAGQHYQSDGFTKNLRPGGHRLDDDDIYAVRGTLLLRLTDSLTNTTIGDYFNNDTHGWNGRMGVAVTSLTPATVPIPGGGSVALSRTLIGLYGQRLVNAIAAVPTDARKQWTDIDEYYRVRTGGIANITQWDVGPGITIKNVFGYRRLKEDLAHDSDGTPLLIAGGDLTRLQYFNNRQHQVSDELQLQGDSFEGKLEWILGAYYFRERSGGTEAQQQLIDTPAGATSPTLIRYGATNYSKSVFAHAIWQVTPQLNLTVGGRYTWDKREVSYDNPQLRFGTPTAACSLAADLDLVDGLRDCHAALSAKYNEPTYTVSLDYKPTDKILLYAAHRRGYRSGGFNGRAANLLVARSFAPETVRDVEVGFKGDWRLSDDAALQTNLAAYKMWYKGIQRSSVIANPAGGLITATVNAASADIKGFEASTTLLLFQRLTLDANWAYADAVHTKFDYANAPGGVVRDVPFGNSKNTVTGSATYIALDEPQIGKVTATANFSYRSSWFLPSELPLLPAGAKIPPRTVWNASIQWGDIRGTNFTAEAFVRNITNKTYVAGGLTALTSLGLTFVNFADPRTYGVRFRYRFE